MKNADRVYKALQKDKQTITEIARFLNLHPSTVGGCIDFLKTQHPIAERQEGLRKYFRLPKQTLPLSTGPGDPWGHLRTWGGDQ
jgi:IS30 family transposase